MPKSVRVLVVEDNPDDAELLLLALRAGGYDPVHERVDTEAAMRAALERAPWDVIVSDFTMPRFSGGAALTLLGNLGLDIPFIIVSGTVGEEAAVKAMRSGAKDYVLKGNLARLCPTIDRELHESELRAQQRKMQDQLVISDRMASVGTLAAGVAHEINNPLAAIIANLELLSDDLQILAKELDLTDRMHEIFDELHDSRESAERLRHIVRDLKLFSRAPDEERRGPVDVQRVLESSLRMAWIEIRHRAHLNKNYGVVPPVAANDARLGQVFLNLVVNAAQSIREGDVKHNSIDVATRVDTSGRVVVEVRDTGAGITPENLPRIFDAFFTTKPLGVGTGLGLSICHRIVANFGGAIEVESQVGRGTTFRVLLLPSHAETVSSQPIEVIPSATRRGRVMVIDDDPTIARVIGRMLGEHEVVVMSSGGEALQRILAGERFDVILSDVMMPQMTGLELHAELATQLPEQAERVVFITGGVFTHAARDGLDKLPNQRLEKPFNARQLRALVNGRIG